MEALFPPCILQSRSLFIWRQERRYKFVDADDKNCLVQLTVVLEFNQGVRQWLYIIAGVLFFGSFFCTSKRKNITPLSVVFLFLIKKKTNSRKLRSYWRNKFKIFVFEKKFYSHL